MVLLFQQHEGIITHITSVKPELCLMFANEWILSHEFFGKVLSLNIANKVLITLIHLEKYKLATKFVDAIPEYHDELESVNALYKVIDLGKYEEIDTYYLSEWDGNSPIDLQYYYANGLMWFRDMDILSPQDNYASFKKMYDEHLKDYEMSLLGRLIVSYAKNKETSPIQITSDMILNICYSFNIHQIVYAIEESVLLVNSDHYSIIYSDRAFNRLVKLILRFYEDTEIKMYTYKDEYTDEDGVFENFGYLNDLDLLHSTPNHRCFAGTMC
jgi:hypothetical protein